MVTSCWCRSPTSILAGRLSPEVGLALGFRVIFIRNPLCSRTAVQGGVGQICWMRWRMEAPLLWHLSSLSASRLFRRQLDLRPRLVHRSSSGGGPDLDPSSISRARSPLRPTLACSFLSRRQSRGGRVAVRYLIQALDSRPITHHCH